MPRRFAPPGAVRALCRFDGSRPGAAGPVAAPRVPL